MGHLYHNPSLKLNTISEEQIAGLLKPETGTDQSGGPGKPVSSEHDRQYCCTPEYKAAVAACTRPVRDQANLYFGME